MKAFTLIELLVVVAIVGILTALAVPAFNSVGQANSITRASTLVSDQIALARQLSMARNRNIEIRLVELNRQGMSEVSGVQLWIESDDGSEQAPLRRLEFLPKGTAISADEELSPLLNADPSVRGSASFGSHGTCSYQGFRIRSSGRLETSVDNSNNFLTVHSPNDLDVPPVNFGTIRINPITARVTVYRP